MHVDKRKADVLISVAAIKDLETWKLTAAQLPRRIESHDYWLIVPDDEVKLFRAQTPETIKIFPESVFTYEFEHMLFECQGKALPARRGWYRQQLIKLSALRAASNSERVIIWDADTVPLREIHLFSEIGSCIYYSGSDYHLPYFENIDRLLGLDKARPESFITQNFPILGSQIRSFFEYIEARHSKNWWEAVISSIDFDEISGFSEYEVLGTFASSFAGGVPESQRGTWSYGVAKQVSHHVRQMSPEPPEFDFLAVEDWAQPKKPYVVIIESVTKTWRAGVRQVSKILQIGRRILNNRGTLETELQKIFSSQSKIQVVQIGANDGIQSDPLRKFLQIAGSYSAKLVEPIPFYFNQLSNLYQDRPDVEVINLAAGSRSGKLELFQIDPRIASEMNEDGPQNNWAIGKGSNSRAAVVYWIYKNSWKGINYMKRIRDWIGAIEKLQVPVIPTRDFIGQAARTLLVIDVPGMDSEVLRGLSLGNLPRWVVIEDGLGRESARNLLLSWGYKQVCDGIDTLFELTHKG
jgi:FkbM family methyltransferase